MRHWVEPMTDRSKDFSFDILACMWSDERKRCAKHKDVKLRLKPPKARMCSVHDSYLCKNPKKRNVYVKKMGLIKYKYEVKPICGLISKNFTVNWKLSKISYLFGNTFRNTDDIEFLIKIICSQTLRNIYILFLIFFGFAKRLGCLFSSI